MGMIALIIVAAVAACLLVTWSLCRAAALGDEIAENLHKEGEHEGEWALLAGRHAVERPRAR